MKFYAQMFNEDPACVRQLRHDKNINAHIEKLLNDSSTSQYFYLLGSMKVIIFRLFVFMPGSRQSLVSF